MLLVVDQHFNIVLFTEARDRTFPVFKDATDQITRYADVERSARAARQDVDPEALHRGETAWIAGSSPAMTKERVKPAHDEGESGIRLKSRTTRRCRDETSRRRRRGWATIPAHDD